MRTSSVLYISAIFFLKAVTCKYVADEVNSVLYDLSISAFPLNEDAKDEEPQNADGTIPGVLDDFVAIGNKHGQKYHCRFPTYVEKTPGSDEGLLDPPATSRVTNEEIQAVLDPVLKGLCFKNARERSGWWTYEFCYKDSIMQYHLENEKKTGETIYLGRFESEKDWSTAEAVAELTGKRKKTLYHSHVYTNGTICDLTQNFRRAEVRFMCSEETHTGAYLHSIDEPESCEYVLTIYTGALCKLPAFLPADRKPPPLKIECQPVLAAPEYDKYLKAKQDEEQRKAEEAAKKKQEQELKLKAQEEKKSRQKSKSESMKTEPALAADSGSERPSGEEKPIFDILGRSKADFLKATAPAREGGGAPPSTAGSDQTPGAGATTEKRIIGGEGTIEYEYMTHWLEQELENLAMAADIQETEEMIASEKDLTPEDMITVNEVKRKSRRVNLFVAFHNQLDDLAEDLWYSIIGYDPKLLKLSALQKSQAMAKIRVALSEAFAYLVSELDDTEHDMELLDEKTDLSGMEAFKRMREMAEGRQRLLQELEESGLDTKEFVKAKIAAMPPITEEELDRLEKEMLAEGEADSATKETGATPGSPASGSASDGAVQDSLAPEDSKKATSEATDAKRKLDELFGKGVKKTSKDSKSADPVASKKDQNPKSLQAETGDGAATETDGKDQPSDVGKVAKKKTLRQEMETQLGNIMGDVERELKEEGAFDDLNDEEVAEVKTEAFRSLAKTLSNLLEKLDEQDRDVSLADQELDHQKKRTSSKMRLTTTKRSKDKDAEKRLNVWRKLVEGIDDDEQTDSSPASKRTPLGKIQVKRGAGTKPDSGNEDGVRVRVSTIKRKDTGESSGDESEDASETAKLEHRLAQKLKDAGFDTQGRPIQVKIITNLDLDENGGSVIHTLSDEESEQFTNIIYTILGGGNELTSEQRRQQSLESSYNFGTTSDSSESKKESAPMKTVVVGGGRP